MGRGAERDGVGGALVGRAGDPRVERAYFAVDPDVVGQRRESEGADEAARDGGEELAVAGEEGASLRVAFSPGSGAGGSGTVNAPTSMRERRDPGKAWAARERLV